MSEKKLSDPKQKIDYYTLLGELIGTIRGVLDYWIPKDDKSGVRKRLEKRLSELIKLNQHE